MSSEPSLPPTDAEHLCETDTATSQVSPEQVIVARPSPELQSRVSELLERAKSQTLTRQEERELDHYLVLEHLLRLAKAHAYRQHPPE
jgi:hypothetical protein